MDFVSESCYLWSNHRSTSPERYKGSSSVISSNILQISDADRQVFRVMTTEVPLREDTLTHVMLMHLTGKPLSPPEALDIVERLMNRAAPLCLKVHTQHANLANRQIHYCNCNGSLWRILTLLQKEPAMEIKNVQLVDALFKLTTYNPPLPPDAVDPSLSGLAVSTWLWTACVMLVVIGCFNPKTVGFEIWRYVHKLIQLVLTGPNESSVVFMWQHHCLFFHLTNCWILGEFPHCES